MYDFDDLNNLLSVALAKNSWALRHATTLWGEPCDVIHGFVIHQFSRRFSGF